MSELTGEQKRASWHATGLRTMLDSRMQEVTALVLMGQYKRAEDKRNEAHALLDDYLDAMTTFLKSIVK
jgi:hypothetical protein